MSCTKEKDTIAEMNSDDYSIEWMKIDYDSIKGLDRNYELIELIIPKDKSKDTLRNQVKFYYDGKLSEAYSQYYDLKVEPTENQHLYKAKIKVHSEYSNLPIRGRYTDFFFLNFYKDSTSIGTKNFENADEFEIEFINFHNDRFVGIVTEFFLRDTIIKNMNDKVNMRTIETVLTNKENMPSIFIENSSFFNERRISLKDYRAKN